MRPPLSKTCTCQVRTIFPDHREAVRANVSIKGIMSQSEVTFPHVAVRTLYTCLNNMVFHKMQCRHLRMLHWLPDPGSCKLLAGSTVCAEKLSKFYSLLTGFGSNVCLTVLLQDCNQSKGATALQSCLPDDMF